MCADSISSMYPLIQAGEGGSTPTSALQLHMRKINGVTALNFIAENHYLGRTKFMSTINYGAYFEGAILGAICFGSPNASDLKGFFTRNDQGGVMEIKRLAMSPKAPKNSESRFIAVSIRMLLKEFPLRLLVTYADSSVGHVGTIYKASGFEYIGLTKAKSDFVDEGGAVVHRGVKKGMKGSWVPRPQKHLYVKRFDCKAVFKPRTIENVQQGELF